MWTLLLLAVAQGFVLGMMHIITRTYGPYL